MRDAHKQYIDRLHQAASNGVDELLKTLKARFLDGDGPYLTQDDNSPLDLVTWAYEEGAEQVREVFIDVFKGEFQQFSVNWLAGIPIDEGLSTMAGYGFSFYESVEQSPEFMKKLLGMFVDFEDEFERLVEAPQHESRAALYLQIVRWRLKCSLGSENHRAMLEQLWQHSSTVNEMVLEKNSLLLKAMAEADPALVGVEKLFAFFVQSRSLGEEDRTDLLEDTMLQVGRFMEKRHLEPLGRALQNLMHREQGRQAEELRFFFDMLGFLFHDDPELHESLIKNLETKSQAKIQEQASREKSDKAKNYFIKSLKDNDPFDSSFLRKGQIAA